ncbi:MAG: cupin domain-containing protein [Candidatus Dormibacteraceae bacterium]
MSAFTTLAELDRTRIWPGVVGRLVKGRNLTVGVVELEPGALVPEHHHPQEQIGFVIQGTITSRCAGEERALGPGGVYRFTDDQPHEIRAGSEGAVVADLFAPPRADWDALETMPPARPRWPGP